MRNLGCSPILWMSGGFVSGSPEDVCHMYDTYVGRVRTNIKIEDTYLAAIMDRFGVHTKTEAVDLALRHLAGQPMSREEAFAMRGSHAIEVIPPDVGPAT